MFNKKSILITGATGSFGNAYTKFLLKNYDCERIIIFSRDELKQYEFSERFKSNKLRFFIGDVRDKDRLNQACRGVDYIVHAAAMKQVVASEYNPFECIKTNIQGANNLIEAAINNKVKKVIALSTDKAVNPINLYGSTKLASDKLFVAANNMVGKDKTIFSVVRYGNVVGSRGSVLPLFLKFNEEKRGYFPITEKEMTRFWFLMKDAINFVQHSFNEMQGGEIFVPKIPSIKIIDLAKTINPSFKLKYIGIRPGEKLDEIMCPKDESNKVIEFKKYFIIGPSIVIGTKKINYQRSKKKEIGKKVYKNFEYNSGTNKHFLKISEIKKTINIDE